MRSSSGMDVAVGTMDVFLGDDVDGCGRAREGLSAPGDGRHRQVHQRFDAHGGEILRLVARALRQRKRRQRGEPRHSHSESVHAVFSSLAQLRVIWTRHARGQRPRARLRLHATRNQRLAERGDGARERAGALLVFKPGRSAELARRFERLETSGSSNR